MNIPQIKETCKGLATNKDFLTALIIILVGTASFGLGRLSVLEDRKVPIRIEYPQEVNAGQGSPAAVGVSSGTKIQPAKSKTAPIEGGYVASKSGKKYHLPWCSGATTIKEENKIWFATKAEAEKAGYTPAGNCKGI